MIFVSSGIFIVCVSLSRKKYKQNTKIRVAAQMIAEFMHIFAEDRFIVNAVMVLGRMRKMRRVSVLLVHNACTIVIASSRHFVKTTKFVRVNMNSRMSQTINGLVMVGFCCVKFLMSTQIFVFVRRCYCFG